MMKKKHKIRMCINNLILKRLSIKEEDSSCKLKDAIYIGRKNNYDFCSAAMCTRDKSREDVISHFQFNAVWNSIIFLTRDKSYSYEEYKDMVKQLIKHKTITIRGYVIYY